MLGWSWPWFAGPRSSTDMLCRLDSCCFLWVTNIEARIHLICRCMSSWAHLCTWWTVVTLLVVGNVRQIGVIVHTLTNTLWLELYVTLNGDRAVTCLSLCSLFALDREESQIESRNLLFLGYGHACVLWDNKDLGLHGAGGGGEEKWLLITNASCFSVPLLLQLSGIHQYWFKRVSKVVMSRRYTAE